MWRLTLALSADYSCCNGCPAVCRLLCSNVQCLAGSLSNLTMASSQYNILLCSETLVSHMRHMSVLLVPRYIHPVLLCRGKMPLARGVMQHFDNPQKFDSCCCEMLVFRVCDVRQP